MEPGIEVPTRSHTAALPVLHIPELALLSDVPDFFYYLEGNFVSQMETFHLFFFVEFKNCLLQKKWRG